MLDSFGGFGKDWILKGFKSGLRGFSTALGIEYLWSFIPSLSLSR